MDPSYLHVGKESIGHWWILRPTKDNAGNAFVYRGFGRDFRSSRCARRQFGADISFMAFAAPQKIQAWRSFLRVQLLIARAFSPLPGSDELSPCFPQFRVDQQSAC
jgi:hypothetical protein